LVLGDIHLAREGMVCGEKNGVDWGRSFVYSEKKDRLTKEGGKSSISWSAEDWRRWALTRSIGGNGRNILRGVSKTKVPTLASPRRNAARELLRRKGADASIGTSYRPKVFSNSRRGSDFRTLLEKER